MSESLKDVEKSYLKLRKLSKNICDLIDKVNGMKQHGMFQVDNLEMIKNIRDNIFSKNDQCRNLIEIVSSNYRMMYEVAIRHQVNFIENEIDEYRGSINLTDIYISILDEDIDKLNNVA